MKTRFLVYSNRREDIDEIQRIFSDLPEVELAWVEDSRLMGVHLEVPFVAREADGMRFRGFDVMRSFVKEVKHGHQDVAAA
jgi:N-acetylglucosamine-6-phosphate deacetylase